MQNAVSFARHHDLDQSILPLYQAWDQPGGHVHRRKKPKPRPAAQKKQKAAHHPLSLYSGKRVPLFSLPIQLHKFWLSSPFGPRKKKAGQRGFHYGIDLAALRGTPVYAAGSGAATCSRGSTGYGNMIVIRHDTTYKTRYAHLQTIAVKNGQHVKKGQRIGTVGDTGHIRKSGKDGSHLHFEVMVYDKRVNPLRYLTYKEI
jgi:murein DD-endopeptidase MepM/ murein hydrolase activator NlpD